MIFFEECQKKAVKCALVVVFGLDHEFVLWELFHVDHVWDQDDFDQKLVD